MKLAGRPRDNQSAACIEMRRAGAFIMHVNAGWIRASGDKEAGLQAAVGDGVDEIDAGEDVAIRDAATATGRERRA